MNRLLQALVLDVRLQSRNGFYYAVGVVVLVMAVVLQWVPQEITARLLPVVLLGNFLLNGLYFMAALVMLERGDGSLEAVVVTPLRRIEYLAAKLISLSGLSLVESLAIVLAADAGPVAYGPLVAGIVLGTSLLALFGFVLVTRYPSVNAFLFPSMAWGTLLVLPLFAYFGIFDVVFMALHPMQPSLDWLARGFNPGATGGVAGLLYSLVWLMGLGWWCRRLLTDFAIAPVRS